MNTKKYIIVVEDELVVQKYLAESLQRNHFEVFAYSSAEAILDSEVISFADAIIMDIQLPGMSGWEATALIKQKYPSVPVIILTAYSDVNYRVQGFEKGADDYIIKPFFMEELLARLKTVLRLYEKIPGSRNTYEIGDLLIDVRSKSVIRNYQTIKLSLTEFNLLLLLAEQQGNPVSKMDIMQKVWNGRYSVGDNTIEVYINFLRNKIDKPFDNKLIHTKSGFGYYLADNS